MTRAVPERVPKDVGDLVAVHDPRPHRPRGVDCPVLEVVHVHAEIQSCTVQLYLIYNVGLEKGSDQLFVTLYTLSIYPFVHKKLIRTLFEAYIVYEANNSMKLYGLLYEIYVTKIVILYII